MPLQVPEPTSAAAIAALTAVVSNGSDPEDSVASSLLARLTATAAAYNADAARYHADEVASAAALVDALAAATRAADKAQGVAPFVEPPVGPDPTAYAYARLNAALDAAMRSSTAGQAVVDSLLACRGAIFNANTPPVAPTTQFLTSLASQAKSLAVYLAP